MIVGLIVERSSGSGLLRYYRQRLGVDAVVARRDEVIRIGADDAVVGSVDDDEIRRSALRLREMVTREQLCARALSLRLIGRVCDVVGGDDRAVDRRRRRTDGERA